MVNSLVLNNFKFSWILFLLVFISLRSNAFDQVYYEFVQGIQDIHSGRSDNHFLVVKPEVSPELVVDQHNTSTYKRVFPNGDFYFLIGKLSDEWTEEDFARYYKVSKWLFKHGFRVIINPVAYISDAREAVQNKLTSVILWNGHGNESGWVKDANFKKLPKDVFTLKRSPRLKFVLFANCYGRASQAYYHLTEDDGFKGKVFSYEGEVTSSDVFDYLENRNFYFDLSEALGVSLSPKIKTDL